LRREFQAVSAPFHRWSVGLTAGLPDRLARSVWNLVALAWLLLAVLALSWAVHPPPAVAGFGPAQVAGELVGFFLWLWFYFTLPTVLLYLPLAGWLAKRGLNRWQLAPLTLLGFPFYVAIGVGTLVEGLPSLALYLLVPIGAAARVRLPGQRVDLRLLALGVAALLEPWRAPASPR
jgi:hypothetical protein